MATKKYEVIESSRDRIVLQLAGQSQNSTIVKYLEIPDVLFNHNSSVPCIDDKDTLIFGIVSARLFANDNQDLELVIYGHTDSSGETEFNKKLSEERAKAIKALLDNDRDTYVDICNSRHKVEDYQTILSALTTVYGWSCDPGAIDNEDGPNTQAAVSSFQADYSTYYGKSIDVDGVVGPQTWGAFFDVITEQIDLIVKSEIGDTKPVITYGKGGNGVVGCGEEFAQDAFARQGRRSKKDRRVEITFANPNDPIDETPYTGPIVFEPLEIKADRPPVEKKPEKPKLKDFEMWCSHTNAKGEKRKTNTSKPLEIVPSTLGDKVTLRTVPNNEELKVTWKGGSYIPENTIGHQTTFRVSGFSAQVKNAFWHCLFGELRVAIPPKKVTISATDAYNKTISNTLCIYPDTKTSYNLDLSKIFTWLGSVNEKFNKLLGITDKNRFQPKLLVGKVGFEGGWEEDPYSNLAFYKFSVKGGFDPLLGFELKALEIPIPGTAVLPPAIQKYIACVSFVITVKGGISLSIGIERSSPTSFKGTGDAGGSIGVGAGLSAKVANGKVLDASALLTSSIELMYKLETFRNDTDKLDLTDTIKITWNGLKGEMSVLILDGVFSRETKVTIIEPKDLWETKKRLWKP